MRFDRTAVYRRVPDAGTLRVVGGLLLGVGLAPVVVGGSSVLAGLLLAPETVALLAWGIRVAAGVAGLALLFGSRGERSPDDPPGSPAAVVLGAVLVGIAAGPLVVAAVVAPIRVGLSAVLPAGVRLRPGDLQLFSLGVHLLAATAGATALHAVGLFYRGSWATTGE